jgi:hypothetical protein
MLLLADLNYKYLFLTLKVVVKKQNSTSINLDYQDTRRNKLAINMYGERNIFSVNFTS